MRFLLIFVLGLLLPGALRPALGQSTAKARATEAKRAIDEGQSLLEGYQSEKAIKQFDRAIKLAPTQPQGFYGRGLAHGQLNEYEEAVQDFTQVIFLRPDATNAYIQRGLNLKALGRHEQALQNFEQAIILDPKEPQAYLGRALERKTLGDAAGAKADFAMAANLDPQYRDSEAAHEGWAFMPWLSWGVAGAVTLMMVVGLFALVKSLRKIG